MKNWTCGILVLEVVCGLACCGAVLAQPPKEGDKAAAHKCVETPANIGQLFKRLQEKEANARFDALVELEKVRPLPERCIAVAGNILVNDPEMAVRTAAIELLRKDYSIERLGYLTRGLRDKDSCVRAYAALALESYKEKALPAISELLKALDDKSNQTIAFVPHQRYARVQCFILDAIGAVGPAAKEALPKLVRLMKNEDNERVCISEALVVLRHRANVKLSAALAIIRINNGDEDALEFLKDALMDELDSSRNEAVYCIERAGPLARTALDRMVLEYWTEDSRSVRVGYLAAFGAIGVRDDRVVTILREAVEGKDEWLRKNATEALEKLCHEKQCPESTKNGKVKKNS